MPPQVVHGGEGVGVERQGGSTTNRNQTAFSRGELHAAAARYQQSTALPFIFWGCLSNVLNPRSSANLWQAFTLPPPTQPLSRPLPFAERGLTGDGDPPTVGSQPSNRWPATSGWDPWGGSISRRPPEWPHTHCACVPAGQWRRCCSYRCSNRAHTFTHKHTQLRA